MKTCCDLIVEVAGCKLPDGTEQFVIAFNEVVPKSVHRVVIFATAQFEK